MSGIPVIRVGVTGHRTKGLEQAQYDDTTVRSAVQKVLSDLVIAAKDLLKGNPQFPNGSQPIFRVVSPLAEGADRIVAEEALNMGLAVESIIPFSTAEYEKDFHTQESREQFRLLLRKSKSRITLEGIERPLAYVAAGRAVLQKSDIVIALWNGQAPEGEGGTGQIVQESLSLNIPTIWIKPDARPFLITGLDPIHCEELNLASDKIARTLHEAFQKAVRKSNSTTELILRIGLSAPSLENYSQDEKNDVLSTINKLLREFREDLRLLGEQNRGLYEDAPPKMRLISSFAAGPEQWAAFQAEEWGLELQCILPTHKDDYTGRFLSASTLGAFEELWNAAKEKLELDGLESDKDSAIEYQGQVLVRQCDILIVVWEGNESNAIGRIVREAISQNLPVVWIKTADPRTPTLLERDKESSDQIKEIEINETTSRLRNIFALAKDVDPEGRSLRRFLSRWQPPKAPLFRKFRDSLSRGWKRHPDIRALDQRKAPPSAWLLLTGPNASVNTEVERRYNDYFTRADHLANVYGDIYRSLFILTYTLGATAVLSAFLGIYLRSHLWFEIELALISLILLVVGLGYWGRLHERWIDYRLLAEGFRQMKFLAPIARITPAFEVPAYLDREDPGRTWFNGYFQAVIREAGLITAKIGSDFMEAYRQELARAVHQQVEYHTVTFVKMKLVHHRLHLFVAYGLFPLTLIACVVHLLLPEDAEIRLGHAGYSRLEFFLSLLAIFLPAAGAAIEGIVHQGEFDRIARRSEGLRARLESLLGKLSPQIPLPQKQPASKELANNAEYFCQIQLLEQADWRAAFVSKPLSPS